MSRYINDIETGMNVAEVAETIAAYLRGEGFEKTGIDGRETWKKGQGIMISPQHIIIEPTAGSVHIEAWLRFALLPGVYLGEMGIDGAFGAIPKRKLRERVKNLEELLGR